MLRRKGRKKTFVVSSNDTRKEYRSHLAFVNPLWDAMDFDDQTHQKYKLHYSAPKTSVGTTKESIIRTQKNELEREVLGKRQKHKS